MSFFSNVLEKLGMKKKAETSTKPTTTTATKPAATAAKPAATAAKPAAPSAAGNQYAARAAEAARVAAAAQAAKPVAVPMVDVVSKLEGLAAASPHKLDWKVSIVDLLKLLDIDSSLESRKELATDLNCPAELMGDSAKMNTWIHKTVLQKIAENGGNIPKELLD